MVRIDLKDAFVGRGSGFKQAGFFGADGLLEHFGEARFASGLVELDGMRIITLDFSGRGLLLREIKDELASNGFGDGAAMAEENAGCSGNGACVEKRILNAAHALHCAERSGDVCRGKAKGKIAKCSKATVFFERIGVAVRDKFFLLPGAQLAGMNFQVTHCILTADSGHGPHSQEPSFN